jgi:uroporphyrin-III C-methyltransferase/precorrin-2 dehydrogenase/sirohydrochlorin ferrochelatase
MRPGMVYLVGAGPGDPELLTLRAARLLAEAEVIVYDHLVSAPILELGRNEAERIYAGKERGNHTLSQTELNQLLVRLAREGKRVVRLKGGDPFIFGRGGEEVEALAAAGIAFEVVPGITAACGIAAYAGIPLTHRDYANSCLFVAGHLKDGSVDLDWDSLVRPGRTLVVYMGLLGLPTLCRELVAHGLSDATPAAIVQHGTTVSQRTVVGTLATLPRLVEAARLAPPTLIIIGEVVRLHAQLAWYEASAADARAGESG